MQEKHIDDHWNVDSNRNLSDSWKGFTKFKTKPPKGYMWSKERLTNIQSTTRPMYGQKRGRKLVQPLRIEKNKNEQNTRRSSTIARKLRGIYFIDPDDEEYKDTLKNARRKLERPLAPAMPCKGAPTSITKLFAQIGDLHPRRLQERFMDV